MTKRRITLIALLAIGILATTLLSQSNILERPGRPGRIEPDRFDKQEAPYVFQPPKISPRLREIASSQEEILVAITLTEQPHRAIIGRNEARASFAIESARRRLVEAAAAARTLGDRPVLDAHADLDRIESTLRRQNFAEIEGAIRPSQAEVERLLLQTGARGVTRFSAINSFTAYLPSWAIDVIAQHPLVAEIAPAETHRAFLSTSVPALGAPAFWNSGFTGASQSVAVLDTGVATDHPAFQGVGFENQIFLEFGSKASCFGDNVATSYDLQSHGTHVAGIVASRGSSDCPSCMGVAKGLGTLYNVKIGYLNKSTAPCTAGGGSANSADVEAAIGWLATNTPVSIMNYSYGALATADDSPTNRSLDQLVDNYGLLFVVAAGNSGPGASTVESPGNAYNIVSVANWSARGTITNSSSRGPTVGGRKKPDIAAPGTIIRSTAFNWSTPLIDDFSYKTGTSMAAPHIAGSAALIRQAGITAPLAIKALLLNTTDNTDWAADRGWGYANLNNTRNSLYAATGTLTARPSAGHFVLYRVPNPSQFWSTVTWNRHIVSGSTSAFNDMDLYAYAGASNTLLDSSSETIENVEQIYTNTADDIIVKLRMFSTSLAGGITSEKFGIAFSDPGAVPKAGPVPRPVCNPVAASVNVGASFTVRCGATNEGDLPAFAIGGSLSLPVGFSGSTSLAFGTLLPAISSTLTDLALVAPATPGTYTISATLSTTTYGETFEASSSFDITVVSVPPGAPSNLSPANGATGISISPALTWTAGSGATSHDVFFGTTATPPLATNTTGTSFNPGTLNSSTTYYWRVLAKNTASSTSSATLSFTTAAPPGAPTGLSPASGATSVVLSPTLTWTAGTGATSHDVFFGTSATPPLAINTTGNTHNPGTLNSSTTYYWRVLAKNAGGSTSSATLSFTTAAPPGAPTGLSPANAATSIVLSPTLNWTAGTGATSHDVFFGTTATPPLATNTTGNTYNPGPLSSATTYYWRVLAKNTGGSTSSATFSFTTQPAVLPPGPPSGLSPGDGATGVSLTPSLTWTAGTGATSHDVYFGNSSNPPFVTNTVLTSFDPGVLSPSSTYYWRIVAKNAGGPTSTAVSSFVTRAAIPAVASKVAAYSGGAWTRDLNGNFAWDGLPTDGLTYWSLNRPGEIPVLGDWNGDGKAKVGLYIDGTWQLDYNGNGVWDGPNVDKLVYFGGPGYTPYVGDWNGSGSSKIAVHQNGTWLIDYNGNFSWDGPGTDRLIYFGGPGYAPVLGDWNGSGTTKLGVHQNGTWLLDFNGNFAWDGPATDKLIFFGGPGYTPVVGDWNGSGTSKVGAQLDGLWVLDYNGNFSWDGLAVDRLIFFGGPGYTPMVGDWNGSGSTKVGAYSGGQWVLDVNGNFAWDPPVDKVIFFGGPGQTPIVGKW